MNILEKINNYLNEDFISIEDMMSIIYTKKGSLKTLKQKLMDLLQDTSGNKPIWDYNEIKKRLMSAGLSSNEVGELRDIFTQSIDAILKLKKVDDISIIKGNFNIYSFPKEYENEVYSKVEKIIKIK
jgi:hypothetical protein